MQRQVLVLLEIAVVTTEGLMAVDGVVGGIDVEDDLGGSRRARTDKEINEVVIEDLQALELCLTNLQQDGAIQEWHVGLPAGVGVEEACQGASGSQGSVGVGALVGEDLEERVVSEVVGIVVVGVSGEQGVDLLGEEGLGGMVDEVGGSWVGKPGGQIGDDAEGSFEGADGEESGIGDEASGLERDVELLRSEVPEGKLAVGR
jgi:hypothetical protein